MEEFLTLDSASGYRFSQETCTQVDNGQRNVDFVSLKIQRNLTHEKRHGSKLPIEVTSTISILVHYGPRTLRH